ncbi:salutaridine reductase-like [Cornus florida]|uniref:salutaridine reductase-like n=1 Tax=Cornus florida TaxID=4283 RepID=UPI00289ED874|nr:salutaridine reductase-like [Cornus florida]XP_059661742.1 salutaridine reductase-like [Cornus florida]XP_059661743.1 salutaridine reductase-like [Cornus florida]XP_059661744.1 salutaridine reductase-like [Cornus florida]
MEETSNSSTGKRLAVVTGGNKGIGLEICRQLASNGIAVILTARDEKKGIEATDNLKVSGLSDVFFHQLDIKDPASIASFAKYVQTHFKKLDILVNNAGIGDWKIVSDENAEKVIKRPYEMAEECLKTNYYGTKGVTEALLPLLQLSNSARIVNVSSVYGQLSYINNEKVKEELQNVASLTEEKIDEVLRWFLIDYKENKLQANGWPPSAYKVSKAAINAYTRLIARKFPDFRVNCVHPGYVKTDITGNMGDLTPEEGARAPVMVALLPDNGPSGSYYDQMHASIF